MTSEMAKTMWKMVKFFTRKDNEIKKLKKELRIYRENKVIPELSNMLDQVIKKNEQINDLKQQLKIHGLHQLDEYITLRTIVSNFKNWQADIEEEANNPEQEKNHKFSPSAVNYNLKRILGIEDGNKK